MLNDPDSGEIELRVSELNAGAFPMSNGLDAFAVALSGRARKGGRDSQSPGRIRHRRSEEAGLVTFAPDDLDWEDEIRVAIEERTSFRPTR